MTQPKIFLTHTDSAHKLSRMKSHLFIFTLFLLSVFTLAQQEWVDDLTGQQVRGGAALRQISTFNTASETTFRVRSANKFSGERGHMSMRLTMNNLGPGMVSSFYMRSTMENNGRQDEIDFEFGGGRNTSQVWLAVHKNGDDQCPWAYDLPFDVTESPHIYTIVWRYNQQRDSTDVVWLIDGCMIKSECVKGKFADMYAVVSGWTAGPKPDEFLVCWMGRLPEGEAKEQRTEWEVISSSSDSAGQGVATQGEGQCKAQCRLGSEAQNPSTMMTTEPALCRPWQKKRCTQCQA